MTHDADAEVLSAVEAFCRNVIAPVAAALDSTGASASRHRPALAALGFWGMNLPSRDGGSGLDPFTLFEAIAVLAGCCASTSSMLTAHFLATDAINAGGNDAQRQRWLPAAASGEILCAFALTEPGAGSNPADMSCAAVRESRGYRLTGTKHFISNAAEADLMVVFAKTRAAAGPEGISAFLVEPRAGGVACGPAQATMGLRGAHVFEVAFDTLVPEDNRLGAEGSGFRTALKALDRGRLDIAACCIGIAEAALRASTGWLKARRVGGVPLADYQGLQWMLADMAVDIAAARGIAQQANRKRAAGERFSTEAAMAKLFGSEMAARVTDAALQMHGGYGFTRDLPLERYVRDARIMRIYEGSSEVQRNIISRALLGK